MSERVQECDPACGKEHTMGGPFCFCACLVSACRWCPCLKSDPDWTSSAPSWNHQSLLAGRGHNCVCPCVCVCPLRFVWGSFSAWLSSRTATSFCYFIAVCLIWNQTGVQPLLCWKNEWNVLTFFPFQINGSITFNNIVQLWQHPRSDRSDCADKSTSVTHTPEFTQFFK